MYECPRKCGGTLWPDNIINNQLTCMLCSRGFIDTGGELVSIENLRPKIDDIPGVRSITSNYLKKRNRRSKYMY